MTHIIPPLENPPWTEMVEVNPQSVRLFWITIKKKTTTHIHVQSAALNSSAAKHPHLPMDEDTFLPRRIVQDLGCYEPRQNVVTLWFLLAPVLAIFIDTFGSLRFQQQIFIFTTIGLTFRCCVRHVPWNCWLSCFEYGYISKFTLPPLPFTLLLPLEFDCSSSSSLFIEFGKQHFDALPPPSGEECGTLTFSSFFSH